MLIKSYNFAQYSTLKLGAMNNTRNYSSMKYPDIFYLKLPVIDKVTSKVIIMG